jgi:hypothetical protein
MAEVTLAFKIGDKQYVADYRELNGIEARDFRRTVGVPAHLSLSATASGQIDPLEYVAGWKWILDRQEDPTLTYEDVLGSIDGNSWEFVKDAEEEEVDPTHGGVSETSSPPSPPSTESDPGKSIDSNAPSLTSTSAS